ncbi:hypothetical protein GYH30_022777 [Glycine max]|nr:hypothetical protein GYH30_022777 [Glycine max]
MQLQHGRDDHRFGAMAENQDTWRPLSTDGISTGSLRPAETLSPLKEGLDRTDNDDHDSTCGEGRWGQWMKGSLVRAPSVSSSSSSSSCKNKKSYLRFLLGVLGSPLAPVHVCTTDPFPHLSIKDIPFETSSAQYILGQYMAASGGQRL